MRCLIPVLLGLVALPLSGCSPFGISDSPTVTTIVVMQSEATAPQESAPSMSTETKQEQAKPAEKPQDKPKPANKIIPVEALDSVWVPSLCGNQAGQLVGGKLPTSLRDPSNGTNSPAGLAHNQDGTPMGAYTDINGDGRTEAVLAYYCDKGGVTWPHTLLFYDNDLNYVGQYNDWKIGGVEAYKSNITTMRWDDSTVYVDAHGWAPGDSGASPSRLVTYSVKLQGNQPQLALIDNRPAS